MPERLRIAQIAPVAGPVMQYSGQSIEQLVWLLTEELVRRGHDVTLFATGDSQTSAKLRAVYPRGYEASDDLWDWRFHETMHMAAVFEQAHEFDVIHSHVYHYALPFTRLVGTPVIQSYHIMPNADVARGFARYSDAHLIAISRYQSEAFAANPDVTIVYHGINTDDFPFNSTPQDDLIFLGRLLPDKGPLEAVQLARQAGRRLMIAGPIGDHEYFAAKLKPLIDGSQVEYIGPVYGQQRNALLAGAQALLYPLLEPEPFGLVPVEAMACGTPVAALGPGAVPEIVDNGVTGYYTNDLPTLAKRLPQVVALDRARVRQVAVSRFDYRRMIDDYLAVYRRLSGRMK